MTVEKMIDTVAQWAKENDVEYEQAGSAHAVVTLPGEKKLKTAVSVKVSTRTIDVQAFVIRRPDENQEEFLRWLLRRNLNLSLCAFAVDPDGDVYLRAAILPQAWDVAAVDRLMGELLTVADASFNELLTIGFITSMKKEWAWRIARAESTCNLEAFRHLLETPDVNEYLGTYSSAETQQ